LTRAASKWWEAESIGLITTWVDLTKLFIGKFYQPSRTGRKIEANEDNSKDKWDPNNIERGNDEEELTNPRDDNLIEENDIAQIFRIDTDLFDLDTPLCQAFKEFNYLSQIDVDVRTKDIPGFKTYDEYKSDWIYERDNGIPWVNERPWTDNGEWAELIDLPGFIREVNSIRYEDYEWYDTIEDRELKEEALNNKRI
ncbi:hypothetical protein Tco_1261249, partial [Tanacetum coccineum]